MRAPPRNHPSVPRGASRSPRALRPHPRRGAKSRHDDAARAERHGTASCGASPERGPASARCLVASPARRDRMNPFRSLVGLCLVTAFALGCGKKDEKLNDGAKAEKAKSTGDDDDGDKKKKKKSDESAAK